jgi:hypothetical protein
MLSPNLEQPGGEHMAGLSRRRFLQAGMGWVVLGLAACGSQASLTPDQLMDTSLVKELEDSGFIKQIWA